MNKLNRPNIKQKRKFDKNQTRRCSDEEFQMYNHLNSIQDEGDGGNRGITFGRAL